MKAEFMPKIRVEVDFMKASIVQAMGLQGSDVEQHINKAIEEAVKNVDYNAIHA